MVAGGLREKVHGKGIIRKELQPNTYFANSTVTDNDTFDGLHYLLDSIRCAEMMCKGTLSAENQIWSFRSIFWLCVTCVLHRSGIKTKGYGPPPTITFSLIK
jgi:hypothetical protein